MDDEEIDFEALQKQANAALASADVSNIDNMNENDDDIGDVELNEEDYNDPELMAQLNDLGYNEDENGGDNDNKNTVNEDDSGDETMFEEMKENCLKDINKKIDIIKQRYQQYYQSNNLGDAKKCKDAMSELMHVKKTVLKLDVIEFATENDEIQANIKESWSKVPLTESNVAVIKHKSKESTDLDNKITKAEIGINNEEDDEEEEATQEKLMKLFKQYQFAAKKAKDMGDIKQAKAYIIEYKKIKNAMSEIKEGLTIYMNDMPGELDKSLYMPDNVNKKTVGTAPKVVKRVVQKKENVEKIVVKPDSVEKEKVSNNVQGSNNGVLVSVSMLQDRIKNYQIAAVQAKKAGDQQKLKEYFTQYKELKNMLPHIQNGKMKLYEKDLPPKLLSGQVHVQSSTSTTTTSTSSKVVSTKKDNKVVNSKKKSNNESESKNEDKIINKSVKNSEFNINDYKKIVTQLKKQINELRTDAQFLIKEAPDDAQKLLDLSNQSKIQLTKVLECSKQKVKAPEFEIKTIKVKVLKIDNEIQDNELRIEINELKNLQTKGKIGCYIMYKIDGIIEGQTDTQNAEFGCKFNFNKSAKINRQKKLDRKFNFAKLHLELYQTKSWGRAPVLIGDKIVKLRPLLNEFILQETAQLKNQKDDKSRYIADIDFKIRLRRPISAEPTSIVNKKIMNVIKYYQVDNIEQQLSKVQHRRTSQENNNKSKKKRVSQSNKQIVNQPQQQQQPKQQQKKQQTKSQQQPKQIKKQAQPKAKQAKPKPKEPTPYGNVDGSGGLSEDIIEDPHNPIWFESFEVIMSEIEWTQEQINLGKNIEDMTDRLSMLNINKTVLEAKVSSQQLTLEQYSAKVQESIKIHALLAKYLNKINKKQDAVRVLRRYKLMKAEVSGGN